jgi:hypothetical protein
MRVVMIVMVVGMALAGGCGSGPGGGGGGSGAAAHTTAAARPTDPKAQLVAGIRALTSATFRVVEKTTVNTVSSSSEAAVDPAGRAMRLTRSESVAGKVTGTDVIVVGTDLYVRFEESGLPGVPAGTWTHVDGRRLASLGALGIGADDMSGKLALADAVTTIERTGPGELRGTYDTSKAASVLPQVADVLGGEARHASWQARFGEQNRLVWVSVTIPAGGGLPAVTTESRYSGFGEAVTIDRPPAGGTVEAPASLYKIFDR